MLLKDETQRSLKKSNPLRLSTAAHRPVQNSRWPLHPGFEPSRSSKPNASSTSSSAACVSASRPSSPAATSPAPSAWSCPSSSAPRALASNSSAETVSLAHSTVSGIVDRLEKQGLLSTPDPPPHRPSHHAPGRLAPGPRVHGNPHARTYAPPSARSPQPRLPHRTQGHHTRPRHPRPSTLPHSRGRRTKTPTNSTCSCRRISPGAPSIALRAMGWEGKLPPNLSS